MTKESQDQLKKSLLKSAVEKIRQQAVQSVKGSKSNNGK
jgi:hypothetical protein